MDRQNGILLRVLCLGLLDLGISLAACAPAATPPAATATPVPAGAGAPGEGAVLTWERQRGLSGFCDQLFVSADGGVQGRSCQGGPLEQEAVLTAGQRAQLKAWLAELVPFELQADEPAAFTTSVRLVFAGRGDAEPTMDDRRAVEGFAAGVFAELMPAAGPTPTAELLAPQPDDSRAADAARDALARELGVGAEAISVVEVRAREWPDSCLGLAGPDEMCLQVITPGFQVLLQAGGREYVLRANQDGTVVRLEGSGESLDSGATVEGAGS